MTFEDWFELDYPYDEMKNPRCEMCNKKAEIDFYICPCDNEKREEMGQEYIDNQADMNICNTICEDCYDLMKEEMKEKEDKVL